MIKKVILLSMGLLSLNASAQKLYNWDNGAKNGDYFSKNWVAGNDTVLPSETTATDDFRIANGATVTVNQKTKMTASRLSVGIPKENKEGHLVIAPNAELYAERISIGTDRCTGTVRILQGGTLRAKSDITIGGKSGTGSVIIEGGNLYWRPKKAYDYTLTVHEGSSIDLVSGNMNGPKLNLDGGILRIGSKGTLKLYGHDDSFQKTLDGYIENGFLVPLEKNWKIQCEFNERAALWIITTIPGAQAPPLTVARFQPVPSEKTPLAGVSSLQDCAALAKDPNAIQNLVIEFADKMLSNGRDTYGTLHTPRFVNQLDVSTEQLPPIDASPYWPGDKPSRNIGHHPHSSNFDNNTGLLHLLYALSEQTKNPDYAQAADAAIQYEMFIHAGLAENRQVSGDWQSLSLGIHCQNDVVTDQTTFLWHELRNCRPPWGKMYALNPAATKKYAEKLHLHILHPAESPLFNRHYPIKEHTCPLPSSAGCFINGWAAMAKLDGSDFWLKWVTDMSEYYQNDRRPKTNIPRTKGNGTEQVTLGTEPARTFSVQLLYASENLPAVEAKKIQTQAIGYICDMATWIHPTPDIWYEDIHVDTGEPVGPSTTRIWNSGRLVQVAATAAFAARETKNVAVINIAQEMADNLAKDISVDDKSKSAGHLAAAINTFVFQYDATGNKILLEQAAPYVENALKNYWVNGYFIAEPQFGNFYYNRYGSAHLADALFRYALALKGIRYPGTIDVVSML